MPLARVCNALCVPVSPARVVDSLRAPSLRVSKSTSSAVSSSWQGLTVDAQRDVFGDPELDNEGRALLTDHGRFVLINGTTRHDTHTHTHTRTHTHTPG